MDAAGDSARNDAASPSSPIPSNTHHYTLNRQMSGSKKSALARALDCDPDRNEFTIAMEYLHRKKPDSFTIPDSTTADPLEPGSHTMVTATIPAPSITTSCHVEPSLDEHAAPRGLDPYSLWHWGPTETPPAPYIESAPPQKLTATDSASAESAWVKFFLPHLKCSVCDHGFDKTRSGWFHCSQCSNGTFVLCRACYMNAEWCRGDTHTLDQWVFPVDEGVKLNVPDEYISDFFFCVEKSIRRFRSAHTLPTCTTYSLLSPEDSILLDEERLQYKGIVANTVVEETTNPPVFACLFGPIRTAIQLAKSLQDLRIFNCTEPQVKILELFENTKSYGVDIQVYSPINSGKSTAVLLGLILKASIRNKKAAAAYKSPEDFVEVQERNCRAPFAIIVCPTHDLAIEIFRRAWYLCFNTNVKPVLSIDGSDNLTIGDILIGTPGKLTRIAKDRMTGPAQYMVVEEAFEMLEDDTLKNLHCLFHEYGAVDCHTQFWTLLGIDQFYPEPKKNYEKLIGPMAWDNVPFPTYVMPPPLFYSSISEYVHQHFFKVENRYEDLVGRLTKTLYKNDEVKVVVFTETAEECDIVEDLLCRRIDDGFRKVRARSTNMTPRQQEFNVESLRRRQCQILVTTEELASGVKIPDITHIVHFRLPRGEKKMRKSYVEYLQRNGMGGRSNTRVTSWAYYGEEDEKLFVFLAEHLVGFRQAVSTEEVLEKLRNGETISSH